MYSICEGILCDDKWGCVFVGGCSVCCASIGVALCVTCRPYCFYDWVVLCVVSPLVLLYMLRMMPLLGLFYEVGVPYIDGCASELSLTASVLSNQVTTQMYCS